MREAASGWKQELFPVNRQPRLKPGTSGQRPVRHGAGGATGSPAPIPASVVASAHITDHAVIRFLERAYGLDVEAIRQEMANGAQPAIDFGAPCAIVHGVRLLIADGATVVTALPKRRK